ncbi:hypothetical protein FQR65_LT20162 [Abscondita terminalis]|nr:hypothetical protein FQR65_LT20162 [Abscondita terminalis]
MTANDITDALVLANRFIQLRMPFLQLYFSTFGEKATLQLQCDIEIEPLRTEIVMGLTFGIMTMAKALTGINDLHGDIDFDFPKPEDHAQDALGDLVYVEAPEVGRRVTAGAQAGVVESVKTASDIHAPVSGEVVEVNHRRLNKTSDDPDLS